MQRYLTRNPELPASIELLSIVNSLTSTDKKNFIDSFQAIKAATANPVNAIKSE